MYGKIIRHRWFRTSRDRPRDECARLTRTIPRSDAIIICRPVRITDVTNGKPITASVRVPLSSRQRGNGDFNGRPRRVEDPGRRRVLEKRTYTWSYSPPNNVGRIFVFGMKIKKSISLFKNVVAFSNVITRRLLYRSRDDYESQPPIFQDPINGTSRRLALYWINTYIRFYTLTNRFERLTCQYETSEFRLNIISFHIIWSLKQVMTRFFLFVNALLNVFFPYIITSIVFYIYKMTMFMTNFFF